MNLYNFLELLRSYAFLYIIPTVLTLVVAVLIWKVSQKSVKSLATEKAQKTVSSEGLEKWPIGEDLKSGRVFI